MKKSLCIKLCIALSVGLLAISCAHEAKNPQASKKPSDPLKQAIAHEARDAENTQRDKYRHPYETLKFFDVKPDMTVVEVSPGKGWYTEILGPYLKEEGQLYLAIFSENSSDYFKKANAALKKKISENPEAYGEVSYTTLQVPDEIGPVAPKGSADRILTFRNVHNWANSGKIDEVFKDFYDTLKEGGVLGVVDHRAKPETPNLKSSGYISQDKVIQIAEKAGFKLESASEINANPKDTTKHPKGVWTLPPSLRLADKDKDKYMAIGESDRMTLKFVKPNKVSK